MEEALSYYTAHWYPKQLNNFMNSSPLSKIIEYSDANEFYTDSLFYDVFDVNIFHAVTESRR
jgi:hypothetical protein